MKYTSAFLQSLVLLMAVLLPSACSYDVDTAEAEVQDEQENGKLNNCLGAETSINGGCRTDNDNDRDEQSNSIDQTDKTHSSSDEEELKIVSCEGDKCNNCININFVNEPTGVITINGNRYCTEKCILYSDGMSYKDCIHLAHVNTNKNELNNGFEENGSGVNDWSMFNISIDLPEMNSNESALLTTLNKNDKYVFSIVVKGDDISIILNSLNARYYLNYEFEYVNYTLVGNGDNIEHMCKIYGNFKNYLGADINKKCYNISKNDKCETPAGLLYCLCNSCSEISESVETTQVANYINNNYGFKLVQGQNDKLYNKINSINANQIIKNSYFYTGAYSRERHFEFYTSVVSKENQTKSTGVISSAIKSIDYKINSLDLFVPVDNIN